MPPQVPLCVIGGGAIGMRHIEVAQKSDQVKLVSVVEVSPQRREELTNLGLPAAASINDVPEQVRAAIIATPTQLHAKNGLEALERGWAVLMEKPITATLDEADELIRAAQKAGLPLFTGHHRRCHPFSIAARKAITEIGDLVGVQGLWSLRKHDTYYDVEWRRKPGAGPLMTNLSHELDLLNFLIGEITETTALSSSARRGFEIEDTASLSLRFANGALGSFLISDAGASPWSFEAASAENPAIAASGENYLRLVGTAGALEFPSLTIWGRSGPGEIEWSKPLKRSTSPELQKVDPLLEQINRFASVVNGATDEVLCTAQEGLAALEMTLATALSARTGKVIRTGEVPGNFTGT